MTSSPFSKFDQRQTTPMLDEASPAGPLQRLIRSVWPGSSPSLASLLGSSTNRKHDDNNNIEALKTHAHSSSSADRTRSPFKPQKSGRGTSSWQLKEFAEATLGSGSLKKAVKLPEGEDENEWLAVNGTSSVLHAP
jgi:hypothetical protein